MLLRLLVMVAVLVRRLPEVPVTVTGNVIMSGAANGGKGVDCIWAAAPVVV